MNNPTHHPLGNTVRLLLMATLALTLTLGTGLTARAAASPLPVDLGAAAHFAILTKTGITNVPTSAITGDLGASPITATAITGFSLVLDPSGRFSKSTQVTGKIYAANYASPTPANLTTAVLNMQAAYVDAAGRAPDFVNLYAGNLSGRTLAPGVYKWSTGVLVTTAVTLSGPSTAVWIFEIAGNLTLGSGAKVLLSGGAEARNIFWQVGGGVGVNIGTTAHFEGTILAAKAIHLLTGASLNGRALAQTAVTMQKNKIVIPAAITFGTMTFISWPDQDGWVLESGENTSVGGTMEDSAGIVVGDDAGNRQYRAILHFNTSGLPDTAVITSAILRIKRSAQVGVSPFGPLGSLGADIRNPYFGTSSNLQIADFQAAGSAPLVAYFGSTPVNNWFGAYLNTTGRSFVSHTGTTQFRLRFTIGDNNNHSADNLVFFSGNATDPTLRPRLIVNYYLP